MSTPSTPSGNPFATESAWEPSTDTILPSGDHVCTIYEVDGHSTSSGGHPQIELRCGNTFGTIRDWLVVIPATVGKVVQLFEAAGLDRPSDEEVTPEGTGWRFDDGYLYRLTDKKIGVIVREEPDRMDPMKMRTRVKGYVPASSVQGSDLDNDASSFDAAIPPTEEQGKQDDFPF